MHYHHHVIIPHEATPKCGVIGSPGTLITLVVLHTLSGLSPALQLNLFKAWQYHLHYQNVVQLLSRLLTENLEDEFSATVELVGADLVVMESFHEVYVFIPVIRTWVVRLSANMIECARTH
jgi:hypothetical protein